MYSTFFSTFYIYNFAAFKYEAHIGEQYTDYMIFNITAREPTYVTKSWLINNYINRDNYNLSHLTRKNVPLLLLSLTIWTQFFVVKAGGLEHWTVFQHSDWSQFTPCGRGRGPKALKPRPFLCRIDVVSRLNRPWKNRKNNIYYSWYKTMLMTVMFKYWFLIECAKKSNIFSLHILLSFKWMGIFT